MNPDQTTSYIKQTREQIMFAVTGRKGVNIYSITESISGL